MSEKTARHWTAERSSLTDESRLTTQSRHGWRISLVTIDHTQAYSRFAVTRSDICTR